MKKGNISVQTDNIFPIIKQFLYSDQEIFLRELISNAVDATSKLKTLSMKGEISGDLGNTTIEVILDKEQKTLTIRDRGIGMTEEEADKYLNQVAFSSAQEFLEKYKDESNIIGHFGLGFYSAFMVADRVEAVSKSYVPDSQGITWSCEGDPAYTLENNDKVERGTDMVLHINAESTEYLEESRIGELLDKYCKFLPVEIKFGTKEEVSYEGEGDDKKEIKTTVDNIINNPSPAWKKTPVELTDEDYKKFYNELYPFSPEPLFWIHLNIDYPFNLTGVLYFPQLSQTPELQRNKIKLYSNQVYVTDEVKEIVPEFLTLLHGVIDSPDIPLNVSRSYLQSDRNVKKITGYITKKVADKLSDLYKKSADEFKTKWNDIGVFVKYGMLSDEKFHEKSLSFALVKNVEGEYLPIEAYRDKVKDVQTDKNGKIVLLYTNNASDHDSFIQSAKNYGYDVLVFDHVIDNHFIQHIEQKLGNITFVRVDADTVDNLVQKDEAKESVLSETEETTVKTTFEGMLGEKSTVTVVLKPLSPEDQPVIITKPEFMRRMAEMQSLQGMGMGNFPEMYNLVVNTNHPLVAKKLLTAAEDEQKDLAQYLYHLALLNQNMLNGTNLTSFINKTLNFVK